MKNNRHKVIVIGAGQAGLACSHELTRHRIEHVVLERGRIAESWRSKRWDSFTLVTPNWMTQLPGWKYLGDEPEGFMPRIELIELLETYAKSFDSPIREGVEVLEITKDESGFVLKTSNGIQYCNYVVIATATYQKPRIPSIASNFPTDINQIHASDYRNSNALPLGATMVVGSGQSGCQIAEEVMKSGRKVYLATGLAGRLPRRYRGKDGIAWQNILGYLDRTPEMLQSPAMRFRGDPHLTGQDGGRTLSLHRFLEQGMTLVGRLKEIRGRELLFSDDLTENISFADKYEVKFCAEVDAYIDRNKLMVPLPDLLNSDLGGSSQVSTPVHIGKINLDESQIRTVIWATGFDFDFNWVKMQCLDSQGYPLQKRGVTNVPGLYFLGLNWLYKRKSGILFGITEDAEYIGQHIAENIQIVPDGASS